MIEQNRHRGRPRKLSQERVIDDAAGLIMDEGYDALSIRSLASRLGVQSSTLYSYFASIEEIADLAVARMLSGISIPSLTTTPDPVDALVTLFQEIRELLVVHPTAIPARIGSAPWKQMVRMVDRLLAELAGLGLPPDRATVCYEALIGVTMASAAATRREQLVTAVETREHLRTIEPPVDALLAVDEWAEFTAEARFRTMIGELIVSLLPTGQGDALRDPRASLPFPLTTDRFDLAPLGPSDAARFTEYRRDARTARFQSWTPDWSEADTAALIAGQPSTLRSQSGAWLQIAVRDRATGALIGDLAVRAVAEQPDTYELGVTIAPERRGTGAAVEALEALVAALFEQQRAHRLIAITDTRNEAAGRLFRRLAFRHEGCAVQADWFKGEWSSLDSWALLRAERLAHVAS